MSRSTALQPAVSRDPAARIAYPVMVKQQNQAIDAVCRAVDTSLDQTVTPSAAGGN